MLKKLIAPAVAGGILVGSLAVGGAAYAATPTTPRPRTPPSPGPAARQWLRAHRQDLRREGLSISASTIGITPQALRADLVSGQSIAQVAAANGSSASAVESALTKAADGAVQQAQTAGKLTAAQAAAIEARLPAPDRQDRQPRLLSSGRRSTTGGDGRTVHDGPWVETFRPRPVAVRRRRPGRHGGRSGGGRVGRAAR